MLNAGVSEDLLLLVLVGVFSLPFLAIGGLLFISGIASLRQGISFWRSDPIAVMEAGNATGTIELEGRAAVADDQLDSPFTETPCLICTYEIQQYSSSDNGSDWLTIERASQHVPFLLEDTTGGLLIDPDGASISLSTNESIVVGRGETADEPIASFLDEIDVDAGKGSERSLGPIDVKTGDKRRYRERRLDAGDDVYIYGPIEQNPPIPTRASGFNAAVCDTGDDRFVISDSDESTMIRDSLVSGGIISLFSLPFLAIGLWLIGAVLAQFVP